MLMIRKVKDARYRRQRRPVMRYRAILFVACLSASASEAQAPELPSPPGRLVDVGGRRLHLLCSGNGSPTVILEAGASSFAIDWTLVQRSIAATTRVCAYDRAGMGWSDPSPRERNVSAAEDLDKLLVAAGERSPFVLVGASRGGLFIRSYHANHPSKVAGLVFVDPATEDRLFTVVDGRPLLIAAATPEQVRSNMPAKSVAVPKRRPQTGAPFDQLPPELYRTRVVLDERLIASYPDSVTPEFIASNNENERAFLARLLAQRTATAHPFGSVPTVVLSRGSERNAEREAVHAGLAGLSTNFRHSVVTGAGHEIHLFEPTAVVGAIVDVVEAARGQTTLRQR
jgi:pimeloyl-ACP methyl ester carboxylesterase